jgi:ribosomal protein L11 methyltransferase
LVVANILAETIIELMPSLATSLSTPGILIASGIIANRTQAVVDALQENGLLLVEQRDDGEWIALIAGKAKVPNTDP